MRSLILVFYGLVGTLFAQSPPPNIVLFLVDDMGVMDTSVPFLTDASGRPKKSPLNEWYRTPNMERLAAQGIRFNQFQAMSVCSPSRTSILNGQNAARHRVTNWINPYNNNREAHGPAKWNWKGTASDDVTLPMLLQKNGYRTIHIGKAHFGPVKSEGNDPTKLGFDVNIGGNAIGHPGSYYAKDGYGKGGKQAVPHLEKYHGTDTFLTTALTLEAKAQIDASVAAKKPFFLHLSHYAVHSPFQPDPRFIGNYENSDKPAPAQAYASLIEGMDESLGMVLDHLEKSGLAENTLVIFLGDNGSDAPLGDPHEVGSSAPLRGKKATHYEGGMRIPFIAAWAKPDPANRRQQALAIPAGAIQDQIASVEDIFPTLLGITNIKAPESHVIDGQPLNVLLAGKDDPAHRDTFLMHYPHAHRSTYFTSLRKGDWKTIYHYLPGENSPRYELFNLKADPYETTNLADKEPELLASMMKKLVAALEAHDALYPQDEEGKEIRPQLP